MGSVLEHSSFFIFSYFCRMKKKLITILRPALPLAFIAFIWLCRFTPSVAEAYARNVYPVISSGLSLLSSLFTVSLEEPLVAVVVLWLLVWPVCGRRKKMKWRPVLWREAEVLAWVYIWFYLGWGLNYFRPSVYVRAQAAPAAYNEKDFLRFLDTYTDALNRSYTPRFQLDRETMDCEMKAFYRRVPSSFGLARPHDFQLPKYFTFTSLYSAVGVLGSMGPFFAEAQLNEELPPLQLPFTYCHEFSHLLGVSSEAEANYWAYQACIRSSQPEVRYSGYFGILPYVLLNASSLLSEEAFHRWAGGIRPEVMEDYRQKRAYWSAKYNPLVGKVQDYVYDCFLKGNRIASGRKNYAEVVGLLLSVSLPDSL